MEEIKQLRKAMQEARAQEAARFDMVYDVGYFFTIVFEGSEQATAFLKGIGYQLQGDVFIDGRVLAELMGIDLPKIEGMPYNPGRGQMADLVRWPVSKPKARR